MSLEANKEIVRRMFEEDLNTDNRDAADEFFNLDFVDHTNPPHLKYGLDSHKEIARIFHAAFPDVKWTIIDSIAEGDKVVVRLVYRATHTGDFFGIPPTGRQVEVKGTHILRIRNGKIAEHWGNDDDLGLMRQLGVVPEMG
jgi:predicted ester cyclase